MRPLSPLSVNRAESSWHAHSCRRLLARIFGCTYPQLFIESFIGIECKKIFYWGGYPSNQHRGARLSQDHFLVLPTGSQQRLVRADLQNVTLFEDDDAAGSGNRTESMGDDETGAVLHQCRHAGLNLLFTLSVEVAGGFVENQDSRIGQDRPGDGNPLSLSAT